jgi:cytochrome c biogenesis protein CcmG, thiol:disulfide interchange protein DsbE
MSRYADILLLFVILCSMREGTGRQLVPVDLKTLDGKTINSRTLCNGHAPLVIVFWNSFHKNPTRELNAIADHYEQWRNETNARVVVIAEDDARTAWKVPAIVQQHEWEYDFYMDPTQDFKRGMNVIELPHTFVIDSSGYVTWEKMGYAEGDENLIYAELKKIAPL